MFSLAYQLAEINLPCFSPTISMPSRLHWSYALAQFLCIFLIEVKRWNYIVSFYQCWSLEQYHGNKFEWAWCRTSSHHLATSTHDLEEAFLALQVVLQGGLGVIDGRVPQHCRRFIVGLWTHILHNMSMKPAIKLYIFNSNTPRNSWAGRICTVRRCKFIQLLQCYTTWRTCFPTKPVGNLHIHIIHP